MRRDDEDGCCSFDEYRARKIFIVSLTSLEVFFLIIGLAFALAFCIFSAKPVLCDNAAEYIFPGEQNFCHRMCDSDKTISVVVEENLKEYFSSYQFYSRPAIRPSSKVRSFNDHHSVERGKYIYYEFFLPENSTLIYNLRSNDDIKWYF